MPLEDYYKTCCMPQTAEEMENEKKKKNKEYLETAFQHYAEKIKYLYDIENKGKRNLFAETTGANKGMIKLLLKTGTSKTNLKVTI